MKESNFVGYRRLNFKTWCIFTEISFGSRSVFQIKNQATAISRGQIFHKVKHKTYCNPALMWAISSPFGHVQPCCLLQYFNI